MVNNTRWRGSYYSRGSSKNRTWRQRQTGFIVKNPQVITRKGQRNRVIVTNAKTYLGVEPYKKNFYSTDIRQNKLAYRKFRVRVSKNRIGAKKPRKSHNRNLR